MRDFYGSPGKFIQSAMIAISEVDKRGGRIFIRQNICVSRGIRKTELAETFSLRLPYSALLWVYEGYGEGRGLPREHD